MAALSIDRAQSLALDVAAGQALLLAFEGHAAPAHILDAIRAGETPGVALYRALNFDDPEQVRALAASLQAAAAQGDRPPVLIAADQEGGQLMGLGERTAFAGNLALGATGSPDLARRVGRAIGLELAAMGVNVNWAPVCDLNTDPANPAVGVRAFGEDPELVAPLVAAMVEGIQSAGVAATAKHFPGSGQTAVDPHFGLPSLDHDLVRLRRVELPPFRAAIEAGVKLVMAAHVALPAVDDVPDRPAMLSPRVLGDLLRDELGFGGVIVTDALDMKAIDQSGVLVDAITAVGAGVDLLLAGPAQAERRPELEQIRRALIQAGRRGLVPPSSIARAGTNVLTLRRWVAGGQAPPVDVVGSAEHRALAREVAERSVTLVRDLSGTLPLRLAADARVLVVVPRPEDLTPADTSSYLTVELASAIRSFHPTVDELVVPLDLPLGDVQAIRARATDYDLVIVGTINARDVPGQAALVSGLVEDGVTTLAVGLRTPYDLAAYPSAPTYACTYSIHRPSLDALAEALFGRIPFQGRLPVSLPVETAPL